MNDIPAAKPNLILVIDDESAVRSVTTRMLERIGFRAAMAGDGASGVALFAAHADEVLCVLIDLSMPKMSGEATAIELRKLRADARIVLMSGHSADEMAERYAALQFTGFLQKPFTLATLRAAIERIV